MQISSRFLIKIKPILRKSRFLEKMLLCFLVLFVVSVNSQYEGDFCDNNGLQGVCINLRHCPSAIQEIQERKKPKICSFQGPDPIVCCVKSQPTQRPPVLTTNRPDIQTTIPYVPPMYDYMEPTDNKDGSCSPIPPSLTAQPIGRKAWDKCLEYQEKYVFPCTRSQTFFWNRSNNCKNNAHELIVRTTLNEFPHMALLGYANESQSISWDCGGALISDKFVLTAGHCIANRIGPVKYVTVGVLDKRTPDSSKIYKVKNVIPHPEYKSPVKYNDIALIELQIPVRLDEFTVPACLHIGDQANGSRAIATGWSLTQHKGNLSDILQKITFTRLTTTECSQMDQQNSNMTEGFDHKTKACYDDKTRSKDTCQGDSGGPIQIKSKQIYCMYNIVGLSSFGRACGIIGEPAIYTRVAPYVSWIEGIVWPEE